MRSQIGRDRTGSRAKDYILLVLSLVGILIAYEAVVGCGGSVPPSARYQVLDENERDSIGRLQLTQSDPCTTVQLSNEVGLNDAVDCETCGRITWTASQSLFAEISLGSTGDFTTAMICRTGSAPRQGRASITLVGTYTKKLSDENTEERRIFRRIPLRLPE